MKVVIAMPGYNAEKTLEKTYRDIPKKSVDEIIFVDDNSRDETIEVAKKLGIKTFIHKKIKGMVVIRKRAIGKPLSSEQILLLCFTLITNMIQN